MKTLILSFVLLRRRMLANLLAILEICVFCFLLSGIMNIYDASQRQIKFFSDLPYSTYHFAPPYKNFDEGPDEEIMRNFYEFVQTHDWVKGYSEISNSQLFDAADLYRDFQACLLDDLTIENFRFPVSSGSWMSEYTGANIPCVIGGRLASDVQVGDILNIASLTQENVEKIDYDLGFYHSENRHLFDETAVEVIGILETPVFSFNLSGGLRGSFLNPEADRVSTLTEDVDENEAFMFLPRSKFPDTFRTNQTQMLVYCDRGLSSEQEKELNAALFTNCVDIADSVQSEIDYQNGGIAAVMPFTLFCGIAAAVSMLAMSILATLGNMGLYRAYRIVGASQKQIVMINLAHAAVLIAFTILLFTFVQAILTNMQWQSSSFLSIYLGSEQSHFGLLCLVTIPLLVLSVLIPLLITRKRSAIELYRSE